MSGTLSHCGGLNPLLYTAGQPGEVSNKTDEHMYADTEESASRFLLLLFVPSSVRGLPGESSLGQLLWHRRLAVTVGGRGAIAPPLCMVEGQPRLGLYVARLLDQTEGGRHLERGGRLISMRDVNSKMKQPDPHVASQTGTEKPEGLDRLGQRGRSWIKQRRRHRTQPGEN